MKPKTEKRTYVVDNLEIRANGEDEARTLVGYAALFDSLSQDLGGFVEIIRPGAFTKTLQESDVRALKNHNSDYVLGRKSSGTLRLEEDARGLRVEIDTPKAQWANDLVESIERGDVKEMSFQFRKVIDRWTEREGQPDLRELIEVRLFEVSPVTWPAYTDTEISARELRELSNEVIDEQGNKISDEEPPPAGHSLNDHNKRRLQLAERL